MCEEVIDHKIRFLESFVKIHEIDNENVTDQIELLTNDASTRKSFSRGIKILLLAKKKMVLESMGLLTPASSLALSLALIAI